jgi:hypothetical protein
MAYYFADSNSGAEYAQTMSKWIGRIKEKIDRWINAWKDNEDPPKLLLYRNGDESMISDSRSGEVNEYGIGAVSSRILNLLADKPKRVGDVAREFSDIAGFNAGKEVASLREKGLLFQEEDRFLSLVLNRDKLNRDN